MAIAFDVATDGGLVNPATSLSWSHTCTGSNLVLFVAVFGDTVTGDPTGNDITGVTYNSVAMTEIGRKGITGDRWVYLFGLINPASGAHTVTISAGASIAIAGQSASYTGVKQSGLPDNSTTNTAIGATTIVTNLTTVADNCWTFLAAKNSTGASAATADCTLRISSSNGLGIFDKGPVTPPASINNSVTTAPTSSNWGTVMASFAPAGATPFYFLTNVVRN